MDCTSSQHIVDFVIQAIKLKKAQLPKLDNWICGAAADVNYEGDTIPAYAAIITPLGCLALSLFAYEFIIFKSYARLASVPACACPDQTVAGHAGVMKPLCNPLQDRAPHISQDHVIQANCLLPVCGDHWRHQKHGPYAAAMGPPDCAAPRRYNRHISNAVATMLHFLVDAVCSFVTVVFITELTKFLAGRLRPNFLQVDADTSCLVSTARMRLCLCLCCCRTCMANTAAMLA